MGSFKLEKGGSAKSQALSGGALLAILGIVSFFVIAPIVGIILGALGLVFVIGGLAASE